MILLRFARPKFKYETFFFVRWQYCSSYLRVRFSRRVFQTVYVFKHVPVEHFWKHVFKYSGNEIGLTTGLSSKMNQDVIFNGIYNRRFRSPWKYFTIKETFIAADGVNLGGKHLSTPGGRWSVRWRRKNNGNMKNTRRARLNVITANEVQKVKGNRFIDQ